MQRRIADEQVDLYFHRRQLGLRVLRQGARPQTIRAWCGLTKDSFKNLRGRWNIPGDNSRRGRSPYSHRNFFESSETCGRATLFACLCEHMKIIGPERGKAAAKALPSVERAELMCEALQIFREWEPEAEIDFEFASLVATSVVEEKDVRLEHCHCGAAMLVDVNGARRTACHYCQPRAPQQQRAAEKRKRRRSAGQPVDEGVMDNDQEATGEGDSDGLPEWEGGAETRDLKDDGDEEAQEHEGGEEGLNDWQEQAQSQEQREME